MAHQAHKQMVDKLTAQRLMPVFFHYVVYDGIALNGTQFLKLCISFDGFFFLVFGEKCAFEPVKQFEKYVQAFERQIKSNSSQVK